MTYTNGAAAMFLVGFWPALVLAARREVPRAARAGGLAAAAATLAAWLVTQSKGGGIALGLSAVAVLAVSRDRLRLLVPTAIVGRAGRLAVRPAHRAVHERRPPRRGAATPG